MAARFRVGVDRDTPGARLCAGEQRHGQRSSAKALIGDDLALVFDSVRAGHHHRQRDSRDRAAGGIAQHRRHIDGFAATVDAALGIKKRIEWAGRGAALDAAVGEIERGLLQIEEAVIALSVTGGDERRGKTLRPSR